MSDEGHDRSPLETMKSLLAKGQPAYNAYMTMPKVHSDKTVDGDGNIKFEMYAALGVFAKFIDFKGRKRDSQGYAFFTAMGITFSEDEAAPTIEDYFTRLNIICAEAGAEHEGNKTAAALKAAAETAAKVATAEAKMVEAEAKTAAAEAKVAVAEAKAAAAQAAAVEEVAKVLAATAATRDPDAAATATAAARIKAATDEVNAAHTKKLADEADASRTKAATDAAAAAARTKATDEADAMRTKAAADEADATRIKSATATAAEHTALDVAAAAATRTAHEAVAAAAAATAAAAAARTNAPGMTKATPAVAKAVSFELTSTAPDAPDTPLTHGALASVLQKILSGTAASMAPREHDGVSDKTAKCPTARGAFILCGTSGFDHAVQATGIAALVTGMANIDATAPSKVYTNTSNLLRLQSITLLLTGRQMPLGNEWLLKPGQLDYGSDGASVLASHSFGVAEDVTAHLSGQASPSAKRGKIAFTLLGRAVVGDLAAVRSLLALVSADGKHATETRFFARGERHHAITATCPHAWAAPSVEPLQAVVGAAFTTLRLLEGYGSVIRGEGDDKHDCIEPDSQNYASAAAAVTIGKRRGDGRPGPSSDQAAIMGSRFIAALYTELMDKTANDSSGALLADSSTMNAAERADALIADLQNQRALFAVTARSLEALAVGAIPIATESGGGSGAGGGGGTGKKATAATASGGAGGTVTEATPSPAPSLEIKKLGPAMRDALEVLFRSKGTAPGAHLTGVSPGVCLKHLLGVEDHIFPGFHRTHLSKEIATGKATSDWQTAREALGRV